MLLPEKIEFQVILLYQTADPETSDNSAELQVVVPGEKARKGQSEKYK